MLFICLKNQVFIQRGGRRAELHLFNDHMRQELLRNFLRERATLALRVIDSREELFYLAVLP